jgi:hypothetical protein
MTLHDNGCPIDLPNIFTAYQTLPHEFVDLPLFAFPILENKADTLTQSQMLKTEDKDSGHRNQLSYRISRKCMSLTSSQFLLSLLKLAT